MCLLEKWGLFFILKKAHFYPCSLRLSNSLRIAWDIREDLHDDPFGAVDIVAGGIPYQPFSVSGRRRGTDDDRYLWPTFAIIERKQPTWVRIENVTGFVNLALDLVHADLKSKGYKTQAYVLPACGIGTPHERERTFMWRTPTTHDAHPHGICVLLRYPTGKKPNGS